MIRTKEFLTQNKESFQRYASFKDYDVLFEAIEKKTSSDHCIEACKSLIEGISKTVLAQVDVRTQETRDRFNKLEIKNLETSLEKMRNDNEDFHVLYQQAVVVLAAFHHSCEKGLLQAIGNKFCTYIAKIRDKKGDIAHGREAPKIIKSPMNLAFMIESVTDIIAFHMLETLSLIDFQQVDRPSQETLITESFRQKQSFELEVILDEERVIREFNESLDEQYPLKGKLRYSRALFEQYLEDYEIQLQEFIDNKEQELME
ncbi:hypothetical protein [Aliivibrio logei]|uniref:Abortive infection protein-like C-terminal domain-containing protein n=1 Tax=Aliivibrio logei TaxID=688 RepID=A0A1B9P0N3_ALILO|nr:hypothetical protein [Aliivibrio logei]OCH21917.1 hypothetical protein A6E04_08640 [Aliivibrio logei]